MTRRRGAAHFLADGIILLDKPAGQTSFQSLGSLKRRLGTGRVGHTGTLDRFADGLLVVLAGRMTRLCAFATGLDKEYVARITFGRGTDTLDPEGRTTAEGSVPGHAALDAVLPRFLGLSQQRPPAFSAIHVDGRRAYQAARQGEPLELAPRPIRIDSLELLDFTPPVAILRVSCSKGTYVRALARDIAESLGTCAFVSALRRTRVGGFSVDQAVSPELFDPDAHVLPPGAFFDATASLGRLTLTEESIRRVQGGVPLSPAFFAGPVEQDGIFGAFTPRGHLVAVVERTGGRFRYAAVFPEAQAAGEPRP